MMCGKTTAICANPIKVTYETIGTGSVNPSLPPRFDNDIIIVLKSPTPEEKAKELIERFKQYTWSGASYIGIEEVEMMINNPKECALVCVENIQSTIYSIDSRMDATKEITYWNEVREAITKL